MTLKRYTPDQFPVKRGKATLNVDKNGRLTFSPLASELIGLKKDDQVVFLQDEERPSDWYVTKVEKGGFVVRRAGSLYVACIQFVRYLSKELNAEPNFKLPLGETKDGVTALITRHLNK